MIYIKANSKSDTVVEVEDSDLKYVNDDNIKTVSVKENTVFRDNTGSEGLKVVRDGVVINHLEPLENHLNRRFTNFDDELSRHVWGAVKQFNRTTYNVDSYIYLSDVDLYYLENNGAEGGPLRAHFRKYNIENDGENIDSRVLMPNVYNDDRICHGNTSSDNYSSVNKEDAYHNIINGFFTTEFNTDLNYKAVSMDKYRRLEDYFITRRSEQIGVSESDIRGVLHSIKSSYEISLNQGSIQDVNIVALAGIACLLGIDYSIFKSC